MGTRELLLVIGFVIATAVVYQATAPPPAADERGLSSSVSRFFDHVRREIRGNRGTAEIETAATTPLDDEINEVRVVGGFAEVHVRGEDRPDVASSLRVVSHAYDTAEATEYARQTILKPERAAGSLIFRVQYPQGRRSGAQRTFLTLTLPARLRVRIESGPGVLQIANVAAAELTNARGKTTVTKVPGRLVVTHRGGALVIEDAGTLRLTARSSEVTVRGIAGDTVVSLEQGGRITTTQLGGPVEVDARNAAVVLDGLELTRGPIRVSMNGGSVQLTGVKSETRVDGRDAELAISMAAAAPIAIDNENGGVRLTLPATSGYRLDAVVESGRILTADTSLPEGIDATAADSPDGESRAAGAVKGGGPTITIRATRGDVTLVGSGTPKK